MTRLRVLAAAAAVLVLAAVPPVRAQVEAEVEWLLVVQGRVAEFRPGTIILAAPPLAVAFSDRPARAVRLVDLRGFAAGAWGEGGPLRADPPNAAIITAGGRLGIIAITDAIYDNDQLYLWVTLLAGEVPSLGDHIGITMDAFPAAVNAAITDAVAAAAE